MAGDSRQHFEDTQHQGQGQESRHSDLFQCLFQSPFLSHRDGNGSWSSGVRVPLGLEAVERGKKQPGLVTKACGTGVAASVTTGHPPFPQGFVAGPVPPASNCLCPFLTPTPEAPNSTDPLIRNDKLLALLEPKRAPLSLIAGFRWILVALSASSMGEGQEIMEGQAGSRGKYSGNISKFHNQVKK